MELKEKFYTEENQKYTLSKPRVIIGGIILWIILLAIYSIVSQIWM